MSESLAMPLAVLVMLGILSALIIVHEFGHFSVAKLFGFQTPVFGFGLPFGPYKVIGHRWNTEFRIYACVLGGFVAIPELGDETNAREENYGVPLKPFKKFPIWQRALVAFAGVGFNILFAWLIYLFTLGCIGEPSQNVTVNDLPPENPIAAQAGVMKYDRIYSVDDAPIDSTDDLISYLGSKANTPVVLHIKRPEGVVPEKATQAQLDAMQYKNVDIDVTPNQNGKVGMVLEAGPVHYRAVDANPVQLAGLATAKLTKLTGNMLSAMGMMVQGIFSPAPTHKVPGAPPHLGVKDLHGVLAVVAIGANIFQQDWSQLLMFTIYISMDLAIINLFPWPALDGFHLAAMALEAVRGKPMEERAHGEIVKWGFISLLVLMAVIMVNDVRSLMTGEFTLKSKYDKNAKPAETAPAPAQNQPAPAKP